MDRRLEAPGKGWGCGSDKPIGNEFSVALNAFKVAIADIARSIMVAEPPVCSRSADKRGLAKA